MEIDQDPDISTISEGNSTHLQLQQIIFLQVICLLETKRCILGRIFLLFRWFKFTLKPPYSIAHDKLRLAIWDTSF